MLLSFLIYGFTITTSLITLDGIFSSMYFFYAYLFQKSSQKDTLYMTSSLYKSSVLDRYIWYFICGYIYQTFYTLMWIEMGYIPFVGLCIINIPPSQNFLLNKVFNKLFDVIDRKKRKIIKNIGAKQFAKIVNTVIKVYTHHDEEVVKMEDIRYLFDYRNDTLNGLKISAQNLAIVIGIRCVKSYSNVYYSLAKRIYNYKVKNKNNKIKTISPKEVKELVHNICTEKKWEKLLEPNFVQAVLHIYYNSEIDKDNNIFLKAITQFNYSILKFFSVWSIATIFKYICDNWTHIYEIYVLGFISTSIKIIENNLDITLCGSFPLIPTNITIYNVTLNLDSIIHMGLTTSIRMINPIWIIPIIYIVLYFYRYGYKKQHFRKIRHIGRLISIVVGSLLIFKTSNYPLICFVSEFTYLITMNPVVINIYKNIYQNTVNFLLEHQTLTTMQVIETQLYALCIMTFRLVISPDTTQWRITMFATAISVLVIYVMRKEPLKSIPIIAIINISQKSVFNPFHILSNIHNYYLLTNYLHSEKFYSKLYELKYRGTYAFMKYIRDSPDVKHNVDLDRLGLDHVNEKSNIDDIKIEQNNSVMIKRVRNPILLNSFLGD